MEVGLVRDNSYKHPQDFNSVAYKKTSGFVIIFTGWLSSRDCYVHKYLL